jgi:hypothetical protein
MGFYQSDDKADKGVVIRKLWLNSNIRISFPQTLGNDTIIALDAFPYTLRTTGFFGSPSSQYTWNDGSTADTLLVTEPGTYSVDVIFVDGCNIRDEITITRLVLPITLTHFNATRRRYSGTKCFLMNQMAKIALSNLVTFPEFLVMPLVYGRYECSAP